jgi:hypothetical protein
MWSRTRLAGTIASLLLSSCSWPFTAQDLSVEVVSYGRYEAEVAGHFKRSPRVYRTPDQTLIEQTDEIPCRKGERFGVAYRIVERGGNSARFMVDVVWKHPLVHERGDQIHGTETEYSMPVRLRDGSSPIRFSGWGFDQESDLAEGTWTLSILYGTHTLFQQSFDVIGCGVDPIEDLLPDELVP